MVQYVRGSVFDAPPGSILAHAVSCQGKWGAGVAVYFKARFPKAFQDYQARCKKLGSNCLGKSILTKTPDYDVLSLFTSEGFGKAVSEPKVILEATEEALDNATKYLRLGSTINMPRINAGLFRVDWEETEKILNKCQFHCRVWIP